MTILRVYDIKDHVLAVNLQDLLRLLGPGSLEARWVVSTVKSSKPGHEWFEATGEGGERLEQLAQVDGELSGSELASLAVNARQVIWGEFAGWAVTQSAKPWVIMRAIDSTFYEIDSEDEAALAKISAAYKDVRTGEGLITG